MQILALTGNHDRKNFDCGRSELNDWLRQVARQHQGKGLSKTFVAIKDEEAADIYGFYALSLAEIDKQVLPETYQKKLPQRIPALRLGRLAVDSRYQSKGLGKLLLMDAILRTRRVNEEAGVVGLFVDALDDTVAVLSDYLKVEI